MAGARNDCTGGHKDIDEAAASREQEIDEGAQEGCGEKEEGWGYEKSQERDNDVCETVWNATEIPGRYRSGRVGGLREDRDAEEPHVHLR
ncbi:hypothetical protein EG835_13990 [bacterium]|nr:hypothetical protein [bacterium]